MERVPVASAQWFVMGPTDSTIAVLAPDHSIRVVNGATGVELAGSRLEPTSAAVDVVFRPDGEMYVIQGRSPQTERAVITKFADGKHQPVLEVAVAKDREWRACLLGSARSGVATGAALTLVERDASAVHAISRFSFAEGRLEPVQPEIPIAGVSLVSVAPSDAFFAWIRASEDAKRHDLEVFDFSGRLRASHPGIEPIAPYWLEDVDALIFVRKGGGIARLSVEGNVVQSICDGSLTAGIARSDVAPRVKDSANINIEKYSFQGFAQVFEISPFPLNGSGEKRITSDDIDNYGSSWSLRRRFLAYRQCRLGSATDPVVENLVAVDTEHAFAATPLGEREAHRASNSVGPTFGPQSNRVYFVIQDQLYRIDLAPSGD